jgi:hypothetical protein
MGCGATKCKKCGAVKAGCKYILGLCPSCQPKKFIFTK